MPDHGAKEASEHFRSQRQLSSSTLDQYVKMIFRALRLARGFERQKLGRRQKAAKQSVDDAETARLNTEVAALKVCCVHYSLRRSFADGLDVGS